MSSWRNWRPVTFLSMDSFGHEDEYCTLYSCKIRSADLYIPFRDEDGFLFVNHEVDEIPQIPQSTWVNLNWVSNSFYSLFDSTRSQVGHYLHASGLFSTVKKYKDEHPFG